MHILVVEDDQALSKALTSAMKEAGHTFVLVECVRDGVLAVVNNFAEFDAIITDVQLPTFRDSPHPDGTGLDIVRKLSRIHGTDENPTPLYVHSSDPTYRGEDIANWLKDTYPTGVFKKKVFDHGVTTQNVINFIKQLNIH